MTELLYGHEWLTQLVPESLLQFIKGVIKINLITTPEKKVQPLKGHYNRFAWIIINVSTVSSEAVHSAFALSHASELCPEGVIDLLIFFFIIKDITFLTALTTLL